MFCEVATPTSDGDPFILTKFPESYDDEEILKSIPSFSYPCRMKTDNVTHFSFVLTGGDSKWTFGFVRYSKSPANTCLVLLSSLPWHDTFYKTLNHISSLTNKQEGLFVSKFLEALYCLPAPEAGLSLCVNYYVHAREYEFSVPCPDHSKLPCIPDDRNLTEYFNAIDSNNMIMIFASMLNERRILMTSSRLCRLTACIQAANSLIYPMYWQHIFIPVLPVHLLDYLSAPMPFLIGVPSETLSRVKRHELGDVVILDADENKIESPFDDLHMLPTEIISFLKKSLRPQNHLLGDSVARTFLKALVMLIGGYRDALSFPAGQKITFNKEAFVNSRPPPIQPFLERMLQLQIFQQFVEGRLFMLHEGQGFNDEFEFELNLHEDRSANRLKNQYNEWLFEIKKEGSAIIKSVNPAVKSAYRQVRATGRQVRDKSKQAYRGIRSKIQQKVVASGRPEGMDAYGNTKNSRRPKSAPSSPTGSPIEARRNDWVTRFPTGGSTGSGDNHVTGIKKSISGVIVEKTDRTATFVRSRPNTLHHLQHNAPQNVTSASFMNREDSDIIEVATEATEQQVSQKPMIDLDLLGELSEMFATNVSFNPFENMIPKTSSTGITSTDPFSPVFECNLPSSTPSNQNLIGLESPPEDLAAIFDPLLQKNKRELDSNGNGSCMTSGISVSATAAKINGSTSSSHSFDPFASSNDHLSFPSNKSFSPSVNSSLRSSTSNGSVLLPRPPSLKKTVVGSPLIPSPSSSSASNQLFSDFPEVVSTTKNPIDNLLIGNSSDSNIASLSPQESCLFKDSKNKATSSGRSWQQFE